MKKNINLIVNRVSNGVSNYVKGLKENKAKRHLLITDIFVVSLLVYLYLCISMWLIIPTVIPFMAYLLVRCLIEEFVVSLEKMIKEQFGQDVTLENFNETVMKGC